MAFGCAIPRWLSAHGAMRFWRNDEAATIPAGLVSSSTPSRGARVHRTVSRLALFPVQHINQTHIAPFGSEIPATNRFTADSLETGLRIDNSQQTFGDATSGT